MALPVVASATTQCSFGLAPSVLMVLPTNRVIIDKKPAATTMDFAPMVNVMPFGLCNSLANPATAALTAAALGVLTPGPCIPVTTPWKPGSPTVKIGSLPALNNSSTCNCGYGGVIQITFGGATTTTVP